MIKFEFDINKIIQIVNYLLKKNDGEMNYTKLIKLLYIADKEFLKQWDLTISTDNYISMGSGPVLSETFDLIKHKHVNQFLQLKWDTFFVKENYNLKLLQQNNSLSIDLLNNAEKQIIDETFDNFKDMDFNQLIEYTHRKDLFPEVEWEEAYQKKNTSIPIYIDKILISLGRTEKEIDIITKELSIQQKESEFLSKNCS